MDIAERILSGDIRAAARLIRDIEDEIPESIEELKKLYPYTGKAYIIGVTGPAGTGKSTIIDRLTYQFRKEGKRVGIVTVDPTSPFTGGAILGDRIRMQSHSTDEGVFIRSMATRGQMGGLARSTIDVVKVLDAMGYEIIIIETVGVGQDEVDIIRVAHTCVLVVIPGMGDDIQAIKAGVIEIADIFAINKCDRNGVEQLVNEIETLLEMKKYGEAQWRPMIVRVQANIGKGIDELVTQIYKHRDYIFRRERSEQYRKERARMEFLNIIEGMIRRKVKSLVNKKLDEIVKEISERGNNPYIIAEGILRNALSAEE